MILATDEKLEIGETYKGMTGDEIGSYYPDQCYKVIRESNRLEWIKNCIQCNPELLWHKFGNPKYYYEILTD